MCCGLLQNRSVVPLQGVVERPKEYNRVLCKRLRADVFSHVEDREECLSLEYTPYCVEAPVDMRYPLRTGRMGRSIRLVFGVVVPACAPSELLEHTLRGIAANMLELTSSGWHWSNIAIVVVCDGVDCVSRSTVEYLHSSLRLFEPSMMLSDVSGEIVHMHVYERTVELAKHAQSREYYDPMQMILGMPTQQCGDMKSYMWLLNAFCQQLAPEYVVTLAAGAVPQSNCCARLLEHLAHNPHTAVVFPDTHIPSSSIFHPLIMSQLFLSKLHSAVYAPFHSVVGYVPTTAPVCSVTGLKHCAALRWSNITPAALGHFFEGQVKAIATLGPLHSLRQLTPLDVFAWKLFSSGPVIGTTRVTFDSSATVAVEVPQTFLTFIDQQRIDFNGHFFNSIHYLMDTPRAMLCGSRDAEYAYAGEAAASLARRLFKLPLLLLQYLTIFASVFGSWFTVAAWYVMLEILTDSTLQQHRFQLANGVKYGFRFVFVLLIVGQVMASLGMELKDMRVLYATLGCLHGIIFCCMIAMAVWMIIHVQFHVWMLYAGAGCAACYIVAIVLHNKVYSVVKTALITVFTLPLYWVVIPLHALATCNSVGIHKRFHPRTVGGNGDNVMIDRVGSDSEPLINDPVAAVFMQQSPTFANGRYPKSLDAVDKAIIDDPWDPTRVHNLLSITPSSNTQPLPGEYQQLTSARRRFGAFRTRIIMLWIATNWLAVSFLLYFNFKSAFPWGLVAYGTFLAVTRCVGAVCYLLLKWCGALGRCCGRLCGCGPSATIAMPPPSPHHQHHTAVAPVLSKHHHTSASKLNTVMNDPFPSRGHNNMSSAFGSGLDGRDSTTGVSSSHHQQSHGVMSPEAHMHITAELRDAEATVDKVHASTRDGIAVMQAAKSHLQQQHQQQSSSGLQPLSFQPSPAVVTHTQSGGSSRDVKSSHHQHHQRERSGSRHSVSPLLQSSDDEAAQSSHQLPGVMMMGEPQPQPQPHHSSTLVALAMKGSGRSVRSSGGGSVHSMIRQPSNDSTGMGGGAGTNGLGIRGVGPTQRRTQLPPSLRQLSTGTSDPQQQQQQPYDAPLTPYNEPSPNPNTDGYSHGSGGRGVFSNHDGSLAIEEPVVKLTPHRHRGEVEYETPSSIPVTFPLSATKRIGDPRFDVPMGVSHGDDALLMQAAELAISQSTPSTTSSSTRHITSTVVTVTGDGSNAGMLTRYHTGNTASVNVHKPPTQRLIPPTISQQPRSVGSVSTLHAYTI